MEACILLMAAFVGTIVQLFHRASRRDLKFDHVPGTIASAIYIGGDKLNELLHSPQHQGGFAEALQNKRFRINRQTRRILMNDEEGYEDTLSPDARHSTK